MNINKFPRIRNHSIYRNFDWPAGLPDFAQYNLIYGWNGSGKSTLSNIFRSMEKRASISEGEVVADVDGTQVRGDSLDTAVLPKVKVFNRSFVEENVFTRTGEVTAILFLGEKSKEKQEQIERLRRQVDDPGGLRPQLVLATRDRNIAEQAFDKHCVQGGAKIRELLRSSGPNPYINYDKANYKSKMKELLAKGVDEVKKLRIADADKDRLKAQKDARQKNTLPLTTIQLPNLGLLRSTVTTLVGRPIVSAVLGEFDDAPAVEEWVKQGMHIHQFGTDSGEAVTVTCKFCRNELTNARIKALEGHFNDQYTKLIVDLDSAETALRSEISRLTMKDLPSKEQFNDHLSSVYGDAKSTLVQHAARATGFIEKLRKIIEQRKAQPMKVVDVPGDISDFDVSTNVTTTEAVANIERCISTHNGECNDFTRIVREARESLEVAYLADEVETYQSYVEKTNDMVALQTRLNSEITSNESQIRDLEKEIIEHQTPANELNEELKKYLGRDEIQFNVEGVGYRIFRGGLPASNLSEGEKTAIAFLYFLKSLQDKDFNLKEDVVVIDDPISSLDASSLFCAFGYMKERTKEAGQLFVMTHNFSFFRQVKNWFSYLNGGPRRGQHPKNSIANYYMLEAISEGGVRNSRLVALDPLLWDYESEYHYLFKRVHMGAQLAGGRPLEDYYPLPNIARRLLEGFYGFRYPTVHGLRDQLSKSSGDAALKARVLRFAHTYSHEAGADEAEHDLTLLAETPAVLTDILELIRLEDSGHHAEMMVLVV